MCSDLVRGQTLQSLCEKQSGIKSAPGQVICLFPVYRLLLVAFCCLEKVFYSFIFQLGYSVC